MGKDNLVKPVVQWAGGKRQLLNTIRPLLPKNVNKYCEPFLGGGAVFFDLQPKKAILNDVNGDLMRVYRVIRDNVNELIKTLEQFENTPEMFYRVRDWDKNRQAYESRSDVEKAARVIYLNRTCFRSLYRVNKAGQFNTPFGYRKNPNIVNAPVLRAVSDYFNASDITFSTVDFASGLQNIDTDTFVYFDPPYDPITKTSNFTGYTQGGFTKSDQIRLRKCCDELNRRGVRFMLSNSATDFIKEQYSAYNITVIQARRDINRIVNKRNDVSEVIIRNYE